MLMLLRQVSGAFILLIKAHMDSFQRVYLELFSFLLTQKKLGTSCIRVVFRVARMIPFLMIIN